METIQRRELARKRGDRGESEREKERARESERVR